MIMMPWWIIEGGGAYGYGDVPKQVSPQKSVEDILKGKLGEFPLYGFCLYSDEDKDISNFIRSKGGFLHDLSGNDCLVGVFEDPREWGNSWQNYWHDRLGNEFDNLYDQISNMKKVSNSSFAIADYLGLKRNSLPGILFIDSMTNVRSQFIPIPPNNDKFVNYFKDVFTAVHEAAEVDVGGRVDKLRGTWRYNYWWKWNGSFKAKNLAATIKEWGSITLDSIEPLEKVIAKVMPIALLLWGML